MAPETKWGAHPTIGVSPRSVDLLARPPLPNGGNICFSYIILGLEKWGPPPGGVFFEIYEKIYRKKPT